MKLRETQNRLVAAVTYYNDTMDDLAAARADQDWPNVEYFNAQAVEARAEVERLMTVAMAATVQRPA